MPPTFLTLDEILEIHEDQLAQYGGTPGILHLDLLESALAQPQVTFDGKFLLGDLFEMSAAYLFHLVQNHPFVDGNKRVGAVAAIVFLLTNDQDIGIGDDELESLTMSVAQGKIGRDAVAAVLRSHAI
jgi:death on curing protein